VYSLELIKHNFNVLSHKLIMLTQEQNSKKMEKMTETLICIPAYNAESTISEVVKQCKEFVDVVLVVNDGSTDNTESIARQAGAEIISHKKNRGYGGAIKTGLIEGLKRNAKITITFDADLQHDASDIPKLIEPIRSEKADIVIGSRFLGHKHNVKSYRKFGIKFITFLVNTFTKNKIKDTESGLRSYSSYALKKIVPTLETEGMGMSAEIILRASVKNLTIFEIPRVENYPDGVSTSTHNPLNHGIHVILTILKLTIETRPIPAFGIPSLVFFIASIISSIYVIDFYNHMSRLPLGLTVFTVLLVFIGFFFILAAMILYVLSKISSKINFQIENKDS